VIDSLKLAQDLIRCPSITPQDHGAQDILITALEPLGFEIYDVTSGEVRNTFFRLGTSAPHLCFCGHTDVVPAGDLQSWKSPPFEAQIHENRLYGRGVSDMKGGIACFVAALSRYLASNTPNGSVSLLITGDEEGAATDGTVKVLEWMAANNHIPDVALVGEPTHPEKLGDEIKLGRRGSLNGTLTVKGIQGHVAYPHLADNPLPALVRLADILASYEFDQGNDFFPATHLQLTSIDTNNETENVIPAQACVRFNVRFNDQWNAAQLETKIREILDQADIDYQLETRSNAESFLTPPCLFTEIVTKAVQNITGNMPELSTKGGTSDARFVHSYCPVVECGLVNKTIHQIDEYAELSDMAQLELIYEDILKQYFTV